MGICCSVCSTIKAIEQDLKGILNVFLYLLPFFYYHTILLMFLYLSPIIYYHTIIVVKEVLDKTKEVLDNAEKTIVVLETAVSGVVDQIKDVKGDIANVMGMFPSLPKLPDGYLLGVIPAGGLKWMVYHYHIISTNNHIIIILYY